MTVYQELLDLLRKKKVVAETLLNMGEVTHAHNEMTLILGLARAYYNRNMLTGAEKGIILRLVNDYMNDIKVR